MFIQRTAEVSKVAEHNDHNFGSKKRKHKKTDETETWNSKFGEAFKKSLHKKLLTRYSVEEDSKFTAQYLTEV